MGRHTAVGRDDGVASGPRDEQYRRRLRLAQTWQFGGEESRIGLLSRSDPPGVVGPVRYLTDALVFIGAAEFEMTIDQFLNEAIDGYASGTDRLALQAQVEALRAERDDLETSEWRRMEARLGFDPDAAPDAVVEALATLAGSYGNAGVEEAAMATPGPGAADTLEAGIEAARRTRVECRFGPALKALGPITRNGEAPWRLAERSASSLRRAFGCVAGQLSNANLANLLETSRANFKTTVRTSAAGLPYGLRLVADDSDRHRIVIRSRWSGDRRFELARGLGDAIWADCDRLGPLAASKSARQKFQRAFAQSFCVRYEDLIAEIGTQPPTDDDIAAAANHFYVSERVVRTVLVNKGILDRDRLERLPAQTLGLVGLGDWVEAA